MTVIRTRHDGPGWSEREWTADATGDVIDARGMQIMSAVIDVDTANSDTVVIQGSNDNVFYVDLGSYTAASATELERYAYYKVTFGGASKVYFYGKV